MLRKKICIVATVPYALNMFMAPHIRMLAKTYDVTLITNGQHSDLDFCIGEIIHFIPLGIVRKISLLHDVRVLISLCFIFRSQQFDAVHSLTPKMGLLAMVAACLTRVPRRIHTFTGQVWANKQGVARWCLKFLDKLTATCATNLLADSASQRQFLLDQSVTTNSKISVLGLGSVCGVDMARFRPNSIVRHAVRRSMTIADDDLVVLFLGRLTKDKGILDLVLAFSALADEIPNLHLLVVGPDESHVESTILKILEKHEQRFHRVGFTNVPEEYMACADVIGLPSYREGFGSVIIEAAAVGIPAVASDIYGLVDAVVDGKTGILHEAKNVSEIRSALVRLLSNAKLRTEMGNAAQARARACFDVSTLASEMDTFYKHQVFGM